MIKLVSIIGTRADIIKMSRLIVLLDEEKRFHHVALYSNQHHEMGVEKLEEFNLSYMQVNPISVNDKINKLAKLSLEIENSLSLINPDLVIVHGDTLTAIAGVFAATKKRIGVAHVEAGLRSNNIYSPYPEELNRTLISKFSLLHFCPTQASVNNLLLEGVSSESIFLTGNTIVDVVNTVELIKPKNLTKNSILVTTHRRESWAHLPQTMCNVIVQCLKIYDDLSFIVLSHPNPSIFNIYKKKLSNLDRVKLICSDKYINCINYINSVSIVATDSCGIQEEAAILGKPAIILRNETERPESIDQGCAVLSTTEERNILNKIHSLLRDKRVLIAMSKKISDYGCGNASKTIVDILIKRINYK